MKTIQNTTPSRQLGLTIIELLIALTIGVFIIGGVAQIFVATRYSTSITLAENSMQENARFAFNRMTRLIQKAGGFGCQAPEDGVSTSLLDFSEGTFRPWVGLEGWEARDTRFGHVYNFSTDTQVTPSSQWLGHPDSELDTGVTASSQSDILKIWYTDGAAGGLIAASATDLEFSEMDLQESDLIALNDCRVTTFMQACECDTHDGSGCNGTDTQVNIAPSSCNSPGNTSFNPLDLNDDTASVHRVQQALFSVGEADIDGVTSLIIHGLGADARLGEGRELVPGVENIQIRYGEDTNNDKSPNYYVSADEVGNWTKVVSVRLSLLMRSYRDNLTTGSQVIYFNGAKLDVPEGDTYLRRVFSTTISLRNRRIGY